MNIKEAFPEYKKPAIAIDTVIVRTKDVGEVNGVIINGKQTQVLLVRRKGTDLWHLPGTILRLGETTNKAIERILDKKINIDKTAFEQLYTVADNPERDERGHVISIVYIGLYKNMEIADTDLASVYESQWFWVSRRGKVKQLRGEVTDETIVELDFDHEEIIYDTIQRLKGKLMYTDIAFELINSTFTIRELENTFNAINERDIPGFRRYIADKIEETGDKETCTGYRPAKIYKKKVKEDTLDSAKQ